MTVTIQKWLKEEKMRLGRFKICCVNAQKKEAKSFPLKMPRSCWSGQYHIWDDSLDALSIRNNKTLTFDQQGVHIPTK
jgi:hypothetical protein